MGRCKQKDRERKRAAEGCASMFNFVSKKPRVPDEGSASLVGTSASNDEDGCLHAERSNDDQLKTQSIYTGPQVSSYDIGKVIQATMSHTEIDEAINNMSPGDKYMMLKNHVKPGSDYIFPKTYTGGCYRSFKLSWLQEFNWMVYSQNVDGVFCLGCSLFCTNRSAKGSFVTRPFTAWQKKAEKCREHQSSKYHQEALQLKDEFLSSMEKPAANVRTLLDKRKADNVRNNREVVKAVAETVLYCGRQCIALRGHVETPNEERNPGNFLRLLQLVANHNETVKNHLASPMMKNATYISPQTQNEILDIMGNDFILSGLVTEIKEAKFYSILADEVTSHNIEHMAFCVRFVDRESNIREEFLTFVPLSHTTGVYLAKTILQTIEKIGLDPSNIRGQGYDGAANMSSQNVGVQAEIKKRYEV
ncbi:zinc finger MYM-type protein 1 [Nematolebias whitei]|uniref:zinc finger MYM-type protein 1 n=1 Tax=Nematolebias whitei TaxID=451745 RepID=UPI001899E0C9|nr:zinc finger MYM-type protein 1 [Nematolebias whitei]